MNPVVRRWIPLAALVAALAVAVPVLSADPSPAAAPTAPAASPGVPPAASPGGKATAPGQLKDKGPKGPKAPEVAVTFRGTIARALDAKGRPTFTLTSGATTWELSAGPKWWWGADGGPLAAFVGKTVTIAGTHREGSTDVSVDTVDGTAIRAEGRPPWAGGPKVVGERHPGWKAWKTTQSDN